MDDILVDEEGYQQFFEEFKKLQLSFLSNATNGSQAYQEAVGDGWHDNFAYEEATREERNIASKIENMLRDKKRLKMIIVNDMGENAINVGDIIKLSIKYDITDIEIYTLKLTGKYIPNLESQIPEISLNSPLGKAIYGKDIFMPLSYSIEDKTFEIKILEKTNKKNLQ